MNPIRIVLAIAAPLAMIAATAAPAAVFKLNYTTFADGLNSPVSVNATLTTDDGQFYGAGQYLVTSITGTRGSQAITAIADPFSELYYPAVHPDSTYSFNTYVDTFGITFTAGGVDYQLYRDSDDTTFYHEFSSNLNGLLILPSAISVTPYTVTPPAVPEPASWASLILGLGIAGSAMRRRRTAQLSPAIA